MKSIEIDDDLYAFIASQTKHIGESASQILRRLLLPEDGAVSHGVQHGGASSTSVKTSEPKSTDVVETADNGSESTPEVETQVATKTRYKPKRLLKRQPVQQLKQRQRLQRRKLQLKQRQQKRLRAQGQLKRFRKFLQ